MTDKIRPAFYTVMGLGIFLLWLHRIHDPSVRASQRLTDSTTAVNVHSHQTDLRVSRMAAESSLLVGQLRRFARNDSVARGEIARLRLKIPGAQPDTTGGTGESRLPSDSSSPSGCAGAPAACDTLIGEQEAVIASQGAALSIWTALAVERGELLNRALGERDSYKAISHAWEKKAGKHFGCAGGPAVVASLDGHVSAGVGFVCGWRL